MLLVVLGCRMFRSRDVVCLYATHGISMFYVSYATHWTRTFSLESC
jgi:hypothetical protein